MTPFRTLRDERGMTLAELMVATVVAMIVLTIALGFFTSQAKAVRAGTGQFVLTQNYRMALGTLASQVRTAGIDVVPGQPFLVYAGPSAVAFNADYVANTRGDLFAVSIDTLAPDGETEALRSTEAVTIPGTGFAYPDTSYRAGSANSRAETMIFFFEPDTTTARTDDYALWRQVNRGPPAVVARNLLQTPGRPFFEYLYPQEHDTASTTVEVISGTALAHTAPVHGAGSGAQPDTGAAARIDRIRGVRVNLTATDGTTGPTERRRAVSRIILLANAGVTRLETCGEVPQLGGGFAATPSAAGAPPRVTLRWPAAVDEGTGEKDVMRYIVWKRDHGAADWGPPLAVVAAGLATYEYADDQVLPGNAYDYALAAEDCTPSDSPQTLASNVIVP